MDEINEIEINETTEVNQAETTEINSSTNDNAAEITETKEVEKPFDISEINFSDEEKYDENYFKVGEYNLEKYKDIINFEDENIKNGLTQLAKEYHENGFSQEQIEFLLDKEIEINKQEELNSRDKIIEDLKKNLTPEVKRNWGTLTKEVSDILERNGYSQHVKAFLGNPILMNIYHSMKKSLMSGNSDSLKQKDIQKNSISGSITAEKAAELLTEMLKTNSYSKEKVADLFARVKNDEKELAKIYLNSYM